MLRLGLALLTDLDALARLSSSDTEALSILTNTLVVNHMMVGC
jgi:hypothetical protein